MVAANARKPGIGRDLMCGGQEDGIIGDGEEKSDGAFPPPARRTARQSRKLLAARVVLNPERSYHAPRHYFLTALVRGGANLEAVRELAGHSKLHTTQRYVHATGADLRDAIARLAGN
jgi:integrase